MLENQMELGLKGWKSSAHVLVRLGSQETRSEGLESSVKGAATGSGCSDEGGPLGLGSLDEILDGHLMGKAQRKGLVLRASIES